MLISILLHYGFKTRLFTEMACNSRHRMILSGECLRVDRNNLLRLPEQDQRWRVLFISDIKTSALNKTEQRSGIKVRCEWKLECLAFPLRISKQHPHPTFVQQDRNDEGFARRPTVVTDETSAAQGVTTVDWSSSVARSYHGVVGSR